MCALLATLGVVRPISSEPRSIVRIVLNAAYQNNEQQAAAIDVLANRLQPTAIEVLPNDTISSLVARLYGFGRKNGLDKVYDAVETAIKRLNNIEDPRELRAGTRLVPTIPSWAKTDFDPDKIQNIVPAFASAVVKDVLIRTQQVAALTTPPAAPSRADHAPQTVAMYLEMSEQEATSLLSLTAADAPGMLLEKPVSVSAPMPVIFAKDDPPDATLPPFSIGEQDLAKLQAAKTKAQRRSILLIVDSGWPTPEIKKQSQADLFQILRTVREAYRLGPGLAKSEDTSWAAPANDHCVLIKAALREMETIDAGALVQTIYVPLSQEQGAATLLKELLYVYFVWQGLEQNHVAPGDVNLAATDFNDVRATAEKTASHSLKSNIPLKATGAALSSEKAIIEALLWIVTQYCEKTGKSFFLNESWTVGKSVQHVTYPTEPRGIVLAAVGNDNGINVYKNRWDFAQRSLQASDHVAVMNAFLGSEPGCISNVVDDFEDTRAIAVNGKITGGPCGTSFSSPRVAWLLAFAEALNPAPAAPQNWANEVQGRLRSWRQPGAGLLRFRLDFSRFVSGL